MRRAVILLSSSSLILAGLATPAAAATPTFAQSVVAPNLLGGEPRAVVSGGTTYVVGPFGSTTVWASTDGGATFAAGASTHQGGGDSDLTVDQAGRVFVNDLLDSGASSTIPISRVDPSGAVSLVGKVDPLATGITHDRAWTVAEAAADGPTAAGHLVTAAKNTSTSLATEQAWTMDVPASGAPVVKGPFQLAPAVVGAAGPIIALPNKTYVMAYEGSDSAGNVDIMLAKSTDNGVTWTDFAVAPSEASTLFPVVAVDSAGTYAVVWSGDVAAAFPFSLIGTRESQVVKAAFSTNGGSTWTSPQIVSVNQLGPLSSLGVGIPDNEPSVFPWVVAGQAGHFDVTYAIAHQAGENPPGLLSPLGGSNFGGPTTTWDLVLAQTLNATAATPTWTRSVVAGAFHLGSICTVGTECAGPQNGGVLNLPTPLDRRDLDFIGTAVNATGNLVVPYTRDRPFLTGNPADLLFSSVDLVTARQTGGSGL